MPARTPQGPRIVAFRNVLAPGYATLDHAKVYEAATTDAPALLRAVEELLAWSFRTRRLIRSDSEI